MNHPRILVIGDAIIDRYLYGTASRLSPEAPIPVVNVEHDAAFPGGAANVAVNLRTLCGESDETIMMCAGTNGGPALYPVKTRLMAGTHQIARWDENDTVDAVSAESIDQAVLLHKPEGIIISDYGKGSINNRAIEVIAEKGLPTFVDTKRNPRDFDEIDDLILFPNTKEYSQYIRDYAKFAHVIAKRGADGIRRERHGEVLYQFPTFAKNVVSVTGAGDTVIAAYAFALFQNYDMDNVLRFANAAAAVVCEKPNTATAMIAEITEKNIFEYHNV